MKVALRHSCVCVACHLRLSMRDVGLVARVIKHGGVGMQSPSDVAHLLLSRLGPSFRSKGLEFKVTILDTARDVEAMLPNNAKPSARPG
eukprot:15286032-Alexandrium_andersonii.AAC.1